jgi:hypothetical protein
MDRRAFLAAAAGIVAAPLVAGAQQAGKVAHIGALGDTSPPVESRRGLVLATLLTRIEDTLYLHRVSAAAGLKLVP